MEISILQFNGQARLGAGASNNITHFLGSEVMAYHGQGLELSCSVLGLTLLGHI